MRPLVLPRPAPETNTAGRGLCGRGPRASVGGQMRAAAAGAQTGARASSPSARGVWCARRAILRATEGAARFPPEPAGALPVVGVIGSTRAGGALRGLEQRPSQERRALAG